MRSNLAELLTSTDSQLLDKAKKTEEGERALKEATNSILDTIGLRHSLFKTVIKFLGHMALRAYFAGPPAKPTRAVKHGVRNIALLLAVLAFALGFSLRQLLLSCFPG